jgi:hypothetical protein
MPKINMKYVDAMVAICKANGFTVTSTISDKHSPTSRHYRGLAIDVRAKDKSKRQVDDFIILLRNLGYNVLDERVSRSKNWTGPHLHVWTYSDEEKIAMKKKSVAKK